jgi:CRP-like cAMP-binding protein
MVTFPEVLAVQTLSLQKGETLFNQGDAVERIYLVNKGKLKLIRNTIDGTPVVLHVGLSGETIAEASLFSDQYHCSAQADVASTLQSVNKQKLLEHLHNNPQQMKQLLAVFSRQVRDLRAINEIKNIRSAEERILAYIRCNINETRVMKLELSLKELAHNIGLAHETFYRELKKLEDKGVIHREKQIIKLL